jgi:hypothetical protein
VEVTVCKWRVFFEIFMGCMEIPDTWIAETSSVMYFVSYSFALHAMSNAFAKSLAHLFISLIRILI